MNTNTTNPMNDLHLYLITKCYRIEYTQGNDYCIINTTSEAVLSLLDGLNYGRTATYLLQAVLIGNCQYRIELATGDN